MEIKTKVNWKRFFKKCFFIGHHWKIHKDKKTITCKECKMMGGFFKKQYIDEAWAYLSVYKKRKLI